MTKLDKDLLRDELYHAIKKVMDKLAEKIHSAVKSEAVPESVEKPDTKYTFFRLQDRRQIEFPGRAGEAGA